MDSNTDRDASALASSHADAVFQSVNPASSATLAPSPQRRWDHDYATDSRHGMGDNDWSHDKRTSSGQHPHSTSNGHPSSPPSASTADPPPPHRSSHSSPPAGPQSSFSSPIFSSTTSTLSTQAPPPLSTAPQQPSSLPPQTSSPNPPQPSPPNPPLPPSASASSPSPLNSPHPHPPSHLGAIVGGTVGALAVVTSAALIFFVYRLRLRRRQRRRSSFYPRPYDVLPSLDMIQTSKQALRSASGNVNANANANAGTSANANASPLAGASALVEGPARAGEEVRGVEPTSAEPRVGAQVAVGEVLVTRPKQGRREIDAALPPLYESIPDHAGTGQRHPLRRLGTVPGPRTRRGSAGVRRASRF